MASQRWDWANDWARTPIDPSNGRFPCARAKAPGLVVDSTFSLVGIGAVSLFILLVDSTLCLVARCEGVILL